MTTLSFTEVDIPSDIDAPPPMSDPQGTTAFDPEFPGSTPEAPYGYKPDGTPYKRRPNGGASKSAGTKKTGRANESVAKTAASMLAQINNLVGLSLMAFGFPESASSIAEANNRFEVMATEALKTDPALCKKIMSAGAASGRTALFMAYGYMGMSIAPAMRNEIIARRAEQEGDDYEV